MGTLICIACGIVGLAIGVAGTWLYFSVAIVGAVLDPERGG